MRQSDEEQAQIKQLLDKMFQIKVIQSVIRTVNTCEQKMIEFGKENKKLITKINGIIVTIFHYFHCWGLIVVYIYCICLGYFILIMQKNAFMVFLLDI